MVYLSKVSKDTEDTALKYLYLRYIFKVSSPTLVSSLLALSHTTFYSDQSTNLCVSVEGGELVLVDVAVDVPDGGPGGRAERAVDVAHQAVDGLFQVLGEMKHFTG